MKIVLALVSIMPLSALSAWISSDQLRYFSPERLNIGNPRLTGVLSNRVLADSAAK